MSGGCHGVWPGRQGGGAMGRLRLRGEDDLTVAISLAVAVGMVLGALAVLWILSGGGWWHP